jgi:hypothetical protein
MILIAVTVAFQDGTNMRLRCGPVQSTLALFTRPVLQRLEENRRKEPLDTLWGIVHLPTDDLLADDTNTFRGLRNRLLLSQCPSWCSSMGRLRVLD